MSNKVYIGIIAVLLGAVGYMAYNINKKEKEIVYINQEKGTVMDEAEGLEVELESMRMKYDTMTVTNSTLAAERDANLAQITELQQKVKSRNYDIKKLQAEAETLRGIMKNYIYQIDSLNTMTKQLAMERDQQAERATTAERIRWTKWFQRAPNCKQVVLITLLYLSAMVANK
jgi:chromosome segregation ATPase